MIQKYAYGGMAFGVAWCIYKIAIIHTMPFKAAPVLAIIAVSGAVGAIIGFFVQRMQK